MAEKSKCKKCKKIIYIPKYAYHNNICNKCNIEEIVKESMK